MTDVPDDPVAVGFKATDQTFIGTLMIIGVLVDVLEQHEPQIRGNFMEKLRNFWDGMSPEEREQPISWPLRCLLDYLQNPDQGMPRVLH